MRKAKLRVEAVALGVEGVVTTVIPDISVVYVDTVKPKAERKARAMQKASRRANRRKR